MPVSGVLTLAVANDEGAARVYLDCKICHNNFIRTEIGYVNWVRDRSDADVNVLVTKQKTASGGLAYQFAFVSNVAGFGDTLQTAVGPNSTTLQRRMAILHMLKVGLMPYVAHTPQIAQLRIDQLDSLVSRKKSSIINDRWDSWVFEIEGGLGFDREQRQGEFELDAGFSANRITEDWRFRSRIRGNYEREHFDDNDQKLTSDSHSNRSWAMLVRSLGSHWSAGISLGTRSSTYDNIKQRLYIEPALEYSYFDYLEADKRELLLIYKAGPRHTSYLDTTIFFKLSEVHLRQELELRLNITQLWGSVEFDIEGSHLIPDVARYRLEMRSELSLRIVRGLSLDIDASFQRINDQVNLPRGNISKEDLLLRRRELGTNYKAELGFGLSYTFGSIFNNVVNTRL